MRAAPQTGQPQTIAPDVIRLLAPNPSPMTFWGTNTYLLGAREVAVIDPGPDDSAHLDAILAAVPPGGQITQILITHSHVDHTALVPRLRAATGAPVLAFGDSAAGARQDLPAGLGGGEGRDAAFVPDRTLSDGQVITAGGQQVSAIWTPGHMGNHMCFRAGEVMFSGDHVMGWATSMVSPPDGDLRAFMTSLDKLADWPAGLYLPGHGDPVTDPEVRVAELIAHRQTRERQIIAALGHGPQTPRQLTATLYRDVNTSLWPAATRNVIAHLIDLNDRNLVVVQGAHSADAQYALQ